MNMKTKVSRMVVACVSTREHYLDALRQTGGKSSNYKLLAREFDKLAVKLTDVVGDMEEIEQLQDEIES